jgi:hypothetical protein
MSLGADGPWGISVLLDGLGALPYRKLRLHGDPRVSLKDDAVGKINAGQIGC